jgi:hypothetical protein
MILIPESREKPSVQDAPPIPGQYFNNLLSLPLAQINSILDTQVAAQKVKQLPTQYSTHGFNPPPILITKPPTTLPPQLPKILFPPKPKTYSKTYIFDKLSPSMQLATQTSTT